MQGAPWGPPFASLATRAERSGPGVTGGPRRQATGNPSGTRSLEHHPRRARVSPRPVRLFPSAWRTEADGRDAASDALMDPRGFDTWTRPLSTQASRRSALSSPCCSAVGRLIRRIAARTRGVAAPLVRNMPAAPAWSAAPAVPARRAALASAPRLGSVVVTVLTAVPGTATIAARVTRPPISMPPVAGVTR